MNTVEKTSRTDPIIRFKETLEIENFPLLIQLPHKDLVEPSVVSITSYLHVETFIYNQSQVR